MEFAAFLRGANTPFVFASGYGEQEAGVSLVSEFTVAKPYDLDSPCNAIVQTLARQGTRSSPVSNPVV